MREDWTSIKLDVAVEVPDLLDLSSLRSSGLQPNEILLPDLDKPPTPPTMDEGVINQLVDMGFPVEACKRAIFFTKNTGLEPATQWIMEHISDDDFGDPFVVPGTGTVPAFVADPNGLEMLCGMGFTVSQATKALKESNNNIERAADLIFSQQDEIANLDVAAMLDNEPAVGGGGGNAAEGAAQKRTRDGDSRKWLSINSHIVNAKPLIINSFIRYLQNTNW